MATVTDEIIDLHDRILGKLFNAAKHKHQQQFQASGKAINAKVRLATSIKQGTVTASLMLRKLGSYPRQNGLAVALRELGGDDFAEYFDPKDGLFTRLQHSADDLVLSATATHLSLAVVPPA